MEASVEDLLLTLQMTDAASVSTETERHRLRDALYAAYRRMQTPWDVALEFSMSSQCTTAAIQIMIDLDLFQKWVSSHLSVLIFPGRRLSHILP
jgi:hypothetical protein